jgi:hypothetical protein
MQRHATPIKTLSFLGAMALAMAVQVFSAVRPVSNFDSDEAVFALMALHMTRGDFTPYMWGDHYLGSLESFISAGFMTIAGTNLIAFRASALLLYAVFLILHGLLVRRLWGPTTAVMSLGILAFPPFLILVWTFRPIGAFTPLLAAGTGLLLLAHSSPFSKRLRRLRWIALGATAGVGIWSHRMFFFYLLTLGIVAFLRSREWTLLYERIEAAARRIGLRSPEPITIPLVLLGVVVASLAMFGDGCAKGDWLGATHSISLRFLPAIGAIMALGLVVASPRRKLLVGGTMWIALGLAIGNLPQWGSWVLGGMTPTSGLLESCPTTIATRAKVLFGQVIPGSAGLPFFTPRSPVGMFSNPWIRTLALVLGGGILLAAIAWFFIRFRHTFRSLLALRPLAPDNAGVAVVGMLLFTEVLAVTLSSNAFDYTASRYLLVFWQALSVILALFIASITVRSGWHRVAAAAILATWLVVVGVPNSAEPLKRFPSDKGPHTPEVAESVERVLHEHGAKGGYSDYWNCYPLTFLSRERIVIAPFNGTFRYQPYNHQVDRLIVYAVIFTAGEIPAGKAVKERLVEGLRVEMRGGPVNGVIAERIANDAVVDRRSVGPWDVWILSGRP